MYRCSPDAVDSANAPISPVAAQHFINRCRSGAKPQSSGPESNVATLPERDRTPALLAFLCEYVIGAAPATTEHDRETQRLLAQLTRHLSVPTKPQLAVPAPDALTRREIEVLDAVADGLSTDEIAARLHISVNTARNHVQRILEKLGVHSRLQAVNAGLHHGLLHRRAG